MPKHEKKKSSPKSPIYRSGRQEIVHFYNLQKIKKQGLLDRDWIQQNCRVCQKWILFAFTKDRLEYISPNTPVDKGPTEDAIRAL